jgi:penicillin-binding protein 1A
MRLLRFLCGLAVLPAILFYAGYLWYQSELNFFNHFVPDDFSFLEESRKGASYTVYDSAGNLMEKRTYQRFEPMTSDDVSLYSDWFRVLDIELDGHSLPVDDLGLFFLDHMDIDTEAIRSYVVNYYTDKLHENTPVTGERLRLLKYLTADKLLNKIGIEKLYAFYADSLMASDNTFGVKAASKKFFSKSFYMANYKETAFLMTLLKDFNSYNPTENFAVAERRSTMLLHLLHRKGVITREEFLDARETRIVLKYDEDPAPVEAEYLKALGDELEKYGISRGEPAKVFTHFDAEKTALLRRVVGSYMKNEEPGIQSAVVLLDISKGGIVAATGAREGKSLKRAFYVKRQTGSTFKPIVYAAAFDKGMKPTDIIDDKRNIYRVGGTDYSPRNFEEFYMGKIFARRGLVFSLNNATIEVALRAGLRKVAETAKEMGMQADVKPFYAMPLGVFPVTPANLAQVYATLADYGVYRDRGLIDYIEFPDGRVFRPNNESKRVISEEAAYQTLYIMQDVPRIGTAKGKGLVKGTSAKTGTTDNYVDAWIASVFYPYVAVVWVGYDANRSMGEKGTGGSKAAPILAAVQKELLGDDYSVKLPAPKGIELLKITPGGKVITEKCRIKQGHIEAINTAHMPALCTN